MCSTTCFGLVLIDSTCPNDPCSILRNCLLCCTCIPFHYSNPCLCPQSLLQMATNISGAFDMASKSTTKLEMTLEEQKISEFHHTVDVQQQYHPVGLGETGSSLVKICDSSVQTILTDANMVPIQCLKEFNDKQLLNFNPSSRFWPVRF